MDIKNIRKYKTIQLNRSYSRNFPYRKSDYMTAFLNSCNFFKKCVIISYISF